MLQDSRFGQQFCTLFKVNFAHQSKLILHTVQSEGTEASELKNTLQFRNVQMQCFLSSGLQHHRNIWPLPTKLLYIKSWTVYNNTRLDSSFSHCVSVSAKSLFECFAMGFILHLVTEIHFHGYMDNAMHRAVAHPKSKKQTVSSSVGHA